MKTDRKVKKRKPGGGRKPIDPAGPLIQISVQLRKSQIDYLQRQSKKGSVPDGARIVIDRDMQQEEGSNATGT